MIDITTMLFRLSDYAGRSLLPWWAVQQINAARQTAEQPVLVVERPGPATRRLEVAGR